MDKVDCAITSVHDPIDKILKRQSERKKLEEEKNNVDTSNIEEIERFIEDFNEKQREIEKNFEVTNSLDHDRLLDHFVSLNDKIVELQRFYSNATIFLRIYDRKICQNALHVLQMKLQDLEKSLLPKKKFGFKTRRNKVEKGDITNGVKETNSVTKRERFRLEETCGFSKKSDEILTLTAEEVEKKDVLLTDITNSSIKVYGNPSTLHMANLQGCQVYSGPVSTSVFVENVKDSSLHLACQQLRIHETTNTDFFVHVTSKAIIEDSKNVRFGVYKLSYEGIDDHYQSSGLNKNVNNWDKVDDFNWLAVDKPSPNWSKLLT